MAEKSAPAFEVDDRVCIKVERELAAFIGSLILATDTKNTAALAVGHQLRKLSTMKNEGKTEVKSS
jgi:hypothetical protein